MANYITWPHNGWPLEIRKVFQSGISPKLRQVEQFFFRHFEGHLILYPRANFYRDCSNNTEVIRQNGDVE